MHFLTRAEQAIKRRIITKMGVVSSQTFHLDSFMISPREDVDRLGVYSEAVDVPCRLPVDGSNFPQHYRARHIYGIERATIDPASGLVYDADGQFIAESSSWLPLRQLWSWPKPRIGRRTEVLAGEHVFLPGEGYFHWLMEDLAPFLRALEQSPAAVIVTPANPRSYAKDLLKILDRPVCYIDRPCTVERLVMVGKIAGIGLSPHPADTDVLRRFFKPWLGKRSRGRRLYLSRVGERRSPTNEAALAERLSAAGFEVFEGQNHSLFEQARLFSEAEVIVGVHGAAFANLVFSSSPKVCELFASDYMPACYAIQADQCGAEYLPLVYDRTGKNVISEEAFASLDRFLQQSEQASDNRPEKRRIARKGRSAVPASNR